MKKDWTLLFGLVASVAACSAELKKLDGDRDDGHSPGDIYYPPSTATETASTPGESSSGGACDAYNCRDVKVFVHYMLTDDLGDHQTVQVEAFDNPSFHGSPVATAAISEFHAETGAWRDVTLGLSPGEYYLRAYLRTDDNGVTPYAMGDMELVAGTPVGVYGALSAPSSVHVAPAYESAATDPVDLNLDQLFKKPGTEPETKAHLRLQLSLATGQTVADHTAVRIRLYATTDLAHDPVYAFDLSSEEFLVTGRAGQAEFVSPSLVEGDYIVFVYVDANGNGFYDQGELAQILRENDQPKKVHIEKERTETVVLELTPTPELPH